MSDKRIIIARWGRTDDVPVPHRRDDPCIWAEMDWDAPVATVRIGSTPGTKVEVDGYVPAEEHARVVAERDALADRLRRAVDVLKSVEWNNDLRCPSCGEWGPDVHEDAGHAPDCALAAVLLEN